MYLFRSIILFAVVNLVSSAPIQCPGGLPCNINNLPGGTSPIPTGIGPAIPNGRGPGPHFDGNDPNLRHNFPFGSIPIFDFPFDWDVPQWLNPYTWQFPDIWSSDSCPIAYICRVGNSQGNSFKKDAGSGKEKANDQAKQV